MSNRQMEEAAELEQDADIAEAVGITTDELNELNYRIEEHESSDGLLYGYNIYFEKGSNPEILSKITGLNNGEWVRIGPLE